MDINLSFKERALKGKNILSKQQPVSLKQAIKQVATLKKSSSVKLKKSKSYYDLLKVIIFYLNQFQVFLSQKGRNKKCFFSKLEKL